MFQVQSPDIPDATSASDNWDETMVQIGISAELRAAILLPEFSDIRFTSTCKFWVWDAMETRYYALRALDRQLKTAKSHIEDAARHQRKRRKAGSISSIPTQPSPSSRKSRPSLPALPASPESPISPPHHEVELELEQQQTSKPEVATVSEAPMKLDGHVMIWRGGRREWNIPFYNESTGEISIPAVSMLPGDFAGDRRLAYFTPQRETADRYAQWAKNKGPNAEVVIIQIAVPNSFVEALSREYLWFGDTWKEVVWYSRRGLELPKKLRYIEQKDLLLGHIASGKVVKYEKLEAHTQIKERDILQVQSGGQDVKAIQWVFSTHKARDGFKENCRSKVWIHSAGTLSTPKE